MVIRCQISLFATLSAVFIVVTGSSVSLPTLPSFEEFLKNPPDSISTDFKINDQCTASVGKTGTTYQVSSNPSDCLNLGSLLELVLPKDKGNFDMGSDFMVLDNIIIRSFSFNTATKDVNIAASYTGTVPIIPGVISIGNIKMNINFVSTRSNQWTFDISASITIGTVAIAVRLNRNEQGYFLDASTDATITANEISKIFQTEKSVLPETGLQDRLKEAKLDSFGIQAPRIKAIFTDGYGFLFGGKIRISDWEPIDVNLLINKPNDGVLSVTIAVYTPTFELAKMFRDIFKMDITDVPVIGKAKIQNLALIISTQDVEAPLALLDIGYRGLFDLPYQKGLKAMFDVHIVDVYVSVSLVITPSELSLTTSNPSDLTLRKIINAFLTDDSSLVSTEAGKEKLNNWPSFIEFDPLAISLSELAIVAKKENGIWGMSNLNIKLVMTEPIRLFNKLITISDLTFEMNWRKTGAAKNISGSIQGTITIGSGKEVSPKAVVRIPFPFANEKISFTFTDFSVHSIVAALGYTLPTDQAFSFLTQMQLDQIVLSFNDQGKLNNISVDCSLPDTWPIYGSFSLGKMKVSITVDNLAVGSSAKVWQIKVSGHVIISSCDITVSTTIGRGVFSVQGKGTNCDISIANLLTAVHVNPSSFPSMISGFTLSDPAVGFHYDRSTGKKSVGFSAKTNLFGSSVAEIALVKTGKSSAVVAAFAVQSASSISEIDFLSNLGLTDVAVIYVSNPTSLGTYKWQNDIFNKYTETQANGQLPQGMTIKARFTPSPNNLVGKLLTQAGKATIEVSLTLPQLLFRLSIQMGDGGLPLGNSGGKFVSMDLMISKSFIGLNVRFSLKLKDVDLMFTGGVKFTFGGTVTISLRMEGNWNEPFGIRGFAIYELGLELGINVASLLPSFGLKGEIQVTPPARTAIKAGLTICVDTANPLATVFEIHFSRLLLADIVNLFSFSDIKLPKQLGEMGFPDNVRIFLSPAGNDQCFGKRYEAGVEIKGTFQIPFLNIHATADIAINLKSFQLKADLRLKPINYGNGLLKIVSAESDSVGPFLKMNIGNADDFLIDGSCKVTLFGASISIRLTIDKQKLFFKGELNLWNLFQVSLTVELVYGGSDPGLRVIGFMKNDLFTKLKARASQGIRKGAQAVNQKLEAAQSKIRNAEREVDKLLDSINYHKRKIEEAKRECSRAPWYKKWICIGTAARIVYHGVVIGGIYVAYGVAKGVLAAARYFLKGVQALVKVGADVLIKLVNAALSLIDIKYVKFDVTLKASQKTFNFEAEIVILGWNLKPKFSINFSSSQTANQGINSAGDKISDDTMKKVN